MTIATLPRATFGALALAVLAGCGGSTDFTIRETFEIDGIDGGDSDLTISLADIAGDAWDHRDKINDAKIKSAVGTITVVHPDNTAASASGSATINRPGGAEVTVASTPSVAIAVGSWLAAEDLDGTARVIKDALKGDGQLEVHTNAVSTGGSLVHIDVEVVIDVEVEWSLF